MNHDIDDTIPMSQLANEAFQTNPTERRPTGQTSFAGAFVLNDANGARSDIQIMQDPLIGKHGKLINDPIHGVYRLDPACSLIFDTRQFQRLRRLKQLGMAYFVFPGASHNRFEHSLGVAHLAYRFANQLRQAQPHELNAIERGDLRRVELAGLCHDLGHGPFSHVFEREFLRQKGVNWDHEDMSALMLDFIIDENAIDVLSPEDVACIKGLITAGHGPSNVTLRGKAGTRWLGEIVANGRNSIDVDKFDYLQRDAHCCGVRVACDFARIMQFSRVIDDEICYKYTEYMNLYELFHARASMHRTVYTHKTAKAIEFMVVDALLEAEPALRIVDRIWKPADFVHLDDGIVDLIENFDLLGPLAANTDEGLHSALRSAQEIIERIRRRKLYKYVTDAPVPVEVVTRGAWVPPTASEIVSHHHGPADVKLRACDIIIQENKIDYAMRDKNPLDHVHFYDHIGSNEKRKLKPEQISSMVMAAYEEKRLRVYSRDPDPKYVAAIHNAFDSWLKCRFSGNVVCSTPAKPLRAAAEAFAEGQKGLKRARALF